MVNQYNLQIEALPRGCHLITKQIESVITSFPQVGLLQVFILHTSAGLTINENYDPDVRYDLNESLNRIIAENEPWYTHTLEGSDDMPAHIKSSIIGSSVMVPINDGKLCLGTWQGIYLCEFRNQGGPRRLVLTVIS